MGQITTFRKKGEERNQSHPLTKPSRGYSENILTPVTLSGVIVPWEKTMNGGRESDYKLICASGLEYFFVADSEWRSVLAWYSWDEVKVVGLLNVSNMTLIPQKVFPKGPTGEKENVIDLAMWKSREAIKKAIKNVNDLVTVPAAVWAVMALSLTQRGGQYAY
jgi:hypothetical protein